MSQLPLLIKGYRAGAIAAGSTVVSQNIFEKHRGQVVGVDLLSMWQIGVATDSPTTLSIGAVEVIQNASLQVYAYNAYPNAVFFPEGVYGDGQTFFLSVTNNGIIGLEPFIHVMHENRFNSPEWLDRFNRVFLGLKERTYLFDYIAGVKLSSTSFVLPKNRGDIIGIQIINDSTAAAKIPSIEAIISVLADGIKIIDNVSIGLGIIECSRDYLVFPIGIPRASTIEVIVSNNAAVAVRCGVRFFFDAFREELPIHCE